MNIISIFRFNYLEFVALSDWEKIQTARKKGRESCPGRRATKPWGGKCA